MLLKEGKTNFKMTTILANFVHFTVAKNMITSLNN